jgi:hypothetical protein
MATLFNHTDNDLFCAALHVTVPARGSVEIEDGDADKVNTVTGVFAVERAQAVRSAVKRGGKVAESSSAPVMETR